MTIHREPEVRVPERFEIVRGEVVELMPTGGAHGIVESGVGSVLRELQNRGLGIAFSGDVGVVVERQPLTCRGADAAFMLQHQLPCETSKEGYLLTPPALVVEVVSPNDRASEIQDKVVEYLHCGVQTVWVVYPSSRTLVVHLPDGTSRRLGSQDVLWAASIPELSTPAAVVFAGLEALRPASGLQP